jgi:hypothetical protein
MHSIISTNEVVGDYTPDPKYCSDPGLKWILMMSDITVGAIITSEV